MVKEYGLSDATAYFLVLIGRLDGEPRLGAPINRVLPTDNEARRHRWSRSRTSVGPSTPIASARAFWALSLTESALTIVAEIEAELSILRETVFATASAADLKASLRVFQTLLE